MLKQKMEKAIAIVKKIEKTPFDEFNVTLDRGAIGGLLRDRLAQLTNMQSSISTQVSRFTYMEKCSEARKKQAKEIALKSAMGSSAIERSSIAEGMDVEIDGKTTSFFNELYNEIVYGYYALVGRYKIKELENNLDIGRSLLSWDRHELEKGVG